MAIQAINSAANYNKQIQTQKNTVTFKNLPSTTSNAQQSTPKGRWWHPVASLWVAGLGQFLQGRNEDGIKHLITMGVLGSITAIMLPTRIPLNNTPTLTRIRSIIAATTSLAGLAFKCYSAYDAYKDTKK